MPAVRRFALNTRGFSTPAAFSAVRHSRLEQALLKRRSGPAGGDKQDLKTAESGGFEVQHPPLVLPRDRQIGLEQLMQRELRPQS